MRDNRETDWADKAGCEKHLVEGKGRYLADGKKLERSCEEVGKQILYRKVKGGDLWGAVDIDREIKF